MTNKDVTIGLRKNQSLSRAYNKSSHNSNFSSINKLFLAVNMVNLLLTLLYYFIFMFSYCFIISDFFAFTVLSNFWKRGINYFKNWFSVKCPIGRNCVSGFPDENFELFHLLLLILTMSVSMLTNCVLVIFRYTSSVIFFQINTSQMFSFPTLESQSQTSISYIHLAVFLNK